MNMRKKIQYIFKINATGNQTGVGCLAYLSTVWVGAIGFKRCPAVSCFRFKSGGAILGSYTVVYSSSTGMLSYFGLCT